MLFRNLFVLFFLCQSYVFGQYTLTKQYTYENGLPANEILSIYKDSRNLLWVGSRFGVIVKDMESFKLLKRFEKIQFNNIATITEDKQHNMWFGSYGQGLVKFTGQGFEKINTSKGLVSDRVRKLFIDNDLVYIATQGGVSIIDLKSQQISNPSFEKSNNIVFEALTFFKYKNKLYVSTIDHGIFEVTKDKLIFVNSFNRLLNAYLYQNKLYFSTYNGFFTINIDDFLAKRDTYHKIDVSSVRDQFISPKRNSLITTGYDNSSGNGMIAEFKNNVFINQNANFKITSEYPNEFALDDQQNLIYLGTLDKGVFEIHLNHFLDYSTIDNRKIIEMFKINGKDYFLSPLGLYIKENELMKTFLSREKFYAFMENNRFRYSKFLQEKNKDFQEINYNLKSNELRFYRIIKYKNSFWVSTNLGLFEVDFQANIKHYLPIKPYYFTYFNDQFIVANSVTGMLIFDDLYNLKYTKFADSQGNVPKDVVSITKNEHAVFFGSTMDGLFKYENGSFTSYLQTNQFKETKLKMIKCIGNNQILVATEFSKVFLLEIKGEQLRQLKEIDIRKIGGENISSIDIFDHKIVIGTNRSLLIFDKDKIYTINNELGFVNKDIHSSIFDGKTLTLGVESGLYKINLNQLINQSKKNHKLIITSVKINEEKFDNDKFMWFDLINKNLELKNNENNIFIDFSLVDVEFPLNYKYRYRVNPDEKWSEYFSDEFVYFRNLSFGSYQVQLEITNTINGNIEIVDLVSFKIKEPFYLNIYFILLSLIALGLLIYKYNSSKIKTLKTINELKINQLNEKSKQETNRLLLERQLTETRLVALQSQMNPHFIFNVLNSIQYYILDNDVDNALNSLGRFSHLIRQMLNLSTKNEISLKEEVDFLKLYVEVENFRWKNKVNFVVNIDESIDIYNVKIPPMLIQPLLENAFVHAFDQNYANPTIMLNFNKLGDLLEINIIDNGKGMIAKEANALHESKALKIIEERLKLLNDNKTKNIEITSDSDGTKVTLVLRIDL